LIVRDQIRTDRPIIIHQIEKRQFELRNRVISSEHHDGDFSRWTRNINSFDADTCFIVDLISPDHNACRDDSASGYVDDRLIDARYQHRDTRRCEIRIVDQEESIGQPD
jgi:hypothetical protein